MTAEGDQLTFKGGRVAAATERQADPAARPAGADGPTGDPGGGEPGPSELRRAALIEAAQARWAAALTDLGGRNTLLYYKAASRDPRPGRR